MRGAGTGWPVKLRQGMADTEEEKGLMTWRGSKGDDGVGRD